MKKFKIIITGLIVALGVTASCDESGLDKVNPNELSAATYFKTSAQLESAVTSCYAYLQGAGNYARYQFYINDNISGENYAAGNLEADKQQYINRDVDEANGGSNQFWQQTYQGVGRCNFVIANEENFDESIPAAEKASRLGEAKFLRAFYYFNLVTHYGDIPLVLNLETKQGGEAKSSVADVYAAIIADLTAAHSSLPAKGDQEQGRITSGAAWALLGRVYLQMGGKDAEAKTALSNVTGYTLVADYRDNFTVAGEHNDESIFEVHYDESTGGGDSWSGTGRGNVETTFRAMEYSGWYNVKPSPALLAEYEAGDSRYAANFYSIGDFYNNGMTEFVSGGIGPDDNPAWRKYQNLDNRASETTDSGINARVIRYADVLLMKAEAEIRSGGTEADALGYLNQVRARASVNLPPVSVTGTQAILDAIEHERWVELAGEQSRFYDLQRFDNDVYLMPIPNVELQANTNL